MMKAIYIILLVLLGSLGVQAQTAQPNLPPGSERYSQTLWIAPDSTLWTGKTGNYIRVADWHDVDSLVLYSLAKLDTFRITPNLYKNQGYNDTEKIQKALDLAVLLHQTLYIGANDESGNSIWMLDSAILMRPNSDIEINSAKIKLKNTTRDNIFRSDNVGIGITNPIKTQNISIRGVGTAILEGADVPRATGDAAKVLTLTPDELGTPTFGTDAGVPGQHQNGDSRNVGILIGLCDGVTITGLRIVRAHAYAISIERSINGVIEDIFIDNPTRRVINGSLTYVKNADGIDLRYGISNFKVDNVFGHSGDDFIALTTLNGDYGPGTMNTINITGNIYNGPEDDSHDIYINNIQAYTYTNLVRLLNIDNSKLYNVTLNNIHDISQSIDSLYVPPVGGTRAAVIVGGGNSSEFGGSTPLGNCKNIFIDNLSSYRYHNGIYIVGSLAESRIVNYYKINSTGVPAVYFDTFQSGGARNVYVDNVNNADSAIWYSSDINGMNVMQVNFVGSNGRGPAISSTTVNAASLGNNTTVYHANSSSTNLPITTTTGGLIFNMAGNNASHFLLYGYRGAEDSFWFARRFAGNTNWYQVASRQFLSSNTSIYFQATQYRLSSLNTAPASATATGTTGEIRITSDYIYVCIATNTWVRAALTTW